MHSQKSNHWIFNDHNVQAKIHMLNQRQNIFQMHLDSTTNTMPTIHFLMVHAGGMEEFGNIMRVQHGPGYRICTPTFSSLMVGSEFWPVMVLEPLCHLHPLWPQVCCWLTDGVSYRLNPVRDEDHLANLSAIMARGNHKSASVHKACLVQMLSAEVKRSWQLILPCKAAFQVAPGCCCCPIGFGAAGLDQ